jgi:hypothetical protein
LLIENSHFKGGIIMQCNDIINYGDFLSLKYCPEISIF